MRTQPNDPLPTAGNVPPALTRPPSKHSRTAARIRDLITENAIKEEKRRRDSHQSLFSLEDLPYTFDDSATAREAVVEKHRQKRSKQQQQPPSAPSSARAAAPPSLLPTTSTAAAGTLRTAMMPREEHLPQYRRSRSFPHESALQKSVEQLVAEMTLMTDPLLKLDIDLPAAAAAASAVSAKSEVSDAVDPAAAADTAAGEKRGRVRRNGFDPSLTLATLIAGGDNKENNGNGYASSLRDGDGGASAVQRLRRLQQQRERRSLDSILLATITEELGPQPSVCQEMLPPAAEKARVTKVRRASFQLDYSLRDLANLTTGQYNEITNYVPDAKDETDTATAARDKSRAQRRAQQRTSLEKLPCMLAEQEIQARAEERERKRQAVLEKRDQHIRDEEEKRQDVFERRVKRQEEKKTKVEAEKRRQLWATVAAAAHAHAYVASRLAACVAANHAAACRHAAATCIAQWWRRRVLVRRAVKERHFLARLKRAKPVLLRLVRRWKRALAASAIARFLVACATAPLRGFSPRFIRKYLKAVRTVQRLVRAFVACHRARVDVLVRMWDRAELAFIRELFAQVRSAPHCPPHREDIH